MSLVVDVNRCINAAPRPVEGEADLIYVGLETADWEDVKLDATIHVHRAVADLIRSGKVIAAHDCSDGGTAVAVTEMALASGLHTQYFIAPGGLTSDPFAEPVAGYILQVTDPNAAKTITKTPGIIVTGIARLSQPAGEPQFHFVPTELPDERRAHSPKPLATIPLSDLRRAWTAPLDW